MARYITQHDNLSLYDRDGTVRHQFINGVLEIGLLTTNGGLNSIDATVQTDADDSLQTPWATDLAGTEVYRLEMAGMGSLTGVNMLGSTLTCLETGYDRIFFYAPVISGGTATSSTVGIWYEVLSGTITYNGVVYAKGEKFVTVTSVTTTTGTGSTYALTIPPAIAKTIDGYRDEYFEQVHLNNPADASGYWDMLEGADTFDSLTSTDSNYFGKIN